MADKLTPEQLAALTARYAPPPARYSPSLADACQRDIGVLFRHIHAQDTRIAALETALEEARPYVQRESRLDIQEEHFYGYEEITTARVVLKNVNVVLYGTAPTTESEAT